MRSFRIILAALASAVIGTAIPVSAQEAGDSFVRVGGARTKLVDKGEVKTDNVLDPNAGYSTREAWHGVVSGGYFVADHIAIEASISTPLTTNNIPAGSLKGLPNLGDDEFITATLGASFHPVKGPVSPYVGAGIQFQRTTQERDALAVGLNIPNAHGPYVSGGVNFSLSRRFGIFAEARKAFYHTNATGLLPTGTLGNGLPGPPYAKVDAKAELDPFTIQIGVVAKFGRGAREEQPAITAENRGFVVKLGMTSLELADKVKLDVAGTPLPGAGLSTFEHKTPSVQVGYFLTPNVAVNAIVGIPPNIDIYGAGSTMGPLGKLGKVRYGPMALTLQYHPLATGRVRPYVGAGLSYMIVFGTKDSAFQNLKISDDLSPAVDAGVDILVTNKTGIFFDVKKTFLRPSTSGTFAGNPVAGRAKLDAVAFSGGISFRF